MANPDRRDAGAPDDAAGAAGPLAGLLVVDLSQFLAGPYASLRLQDLGARVIKVERAGRGDLTRELYLSDTVVDGDSTLFHAINRGKESLALDLKSPVDRKRLRRLIARADAVLQNFRPGVIERLGFDYASVRAARPDIVYGSISGYGTEGPWRDLPGQDLLAQARSGIMWLNGSSGDGPLPVGLSIADMLAGATLVQGVLAGLVRRGLSGRGCHVETSLFECMLDLQFEVLGTHFNDGVSNARGGAMPERARDRSAHVSLAAPYGVYRTRDGWLALAMTPIGRLAELLGSEELARWADVPKAWFAERDEIKRAVADLLAERTTGAWLELFQPADVWCSPVLDWSAMLEHEAFRGLDMLQSLATGRGVPLRLLRSPIRVDGTRGRSVRAAPRIGEHNEALVAEFGLDAAAPRVTR